MTLSPVKRPPSIDEKGLREAAHQLCDCIQKKGFPAFWAGGAVRDRLLGLPLTEIDVATAARPEEVRSWFPEANLVGQSFGVVRVPLSEFCFEVATFRKDGVYLDGRHPERVSYSTDPETDAQRRDFTINAMFYDPVHDTFHDFVGGRRDLEEGLIRSVGNPEKRFREDRLRLLRAIRFAARFDFRIEKETWRAMKSEACFIHEISSERIRDELLKMLTQPHPSRAFRLLSDSGLLKEILPEVEKMKGVEQPPQFHPEGDVFVHTLLMLDLMENPSEELALGVLFHDVGKPETFERADRIRFNRHDKVGAEIFSRIAQRLALSNDRTKTVRELVSQHMKFGAVKKMRPAKLKRFLRQDLFPVLLELHRLDCLGSHRDLDLYDFCREQIEKLPEEELKPPALLTGHDLIRAGYEPGPLFKVILTQVEDAQLEGKLQTREDALAFVLERFPIESEKR